jgi:hypothetical protein
VITVDFHKQITERFFYSLLKNANIEVPEGGWTSDSMLQLAGACALIVQNDSLKVGATQHPEYQEAVIERTGKDVIAAIDFCGSLTLKIDCAQYDNNLEPHLRFNVQGTEPPVGRKVYPVQGFGPEWKDQ